MNDWAMIGTTGFPPSGDIFFLSVFRVIFRFVISSELRPSSSILESSFLFVLPRKKILSSTFPSVDTGACWSIDCKNLRRCAEKTDDTLGHLVFEGCAYVVESPLPFVDLHLKNRPCVTKSKLKKSSTMKMTYYHPSFL